MRNIKKSIIMMASGFILLTLLPYLAPKTLTVILVFCGLILFLIGFVSVGSLGDDIFGKEKIYEN